MNAQLEFYKGDGFVAEIIRTNRRKTATVRVEAGKVSIIVPNGLSDTRIETLMTKKIRWIREKMHLHSHSHPLSPKEYISGESFTYLGKNYRLKLNKGTHLSTRLINGRLLVTLPLQQQSSTTIRRTLLEWYIDHARVKLIEKVKRYAKIIGVEPASVRVKEFKSRWGSCSANGDVQFNWKIIIAPNTIVDYVVAHELCHIKQHDHSPKYWKLLERVIPDYLECREWLKVYGRTLDI